MIRYGALGGAPRSVLVSSVQVEAAKLFSEMGASALKGNEQGGRFLSGPAANEKVPVGTADGASFMMTSALCVGLPAEPSRQAALRALAAAL